MRNLEKITGIILVFLLCSFMSFAQPMKFGAANNWIYVNTYTHTDAQWDSLCGYGSIKLFNHNPAIWVPVYFENIRVEQSGAEAFLRRGTIHGTYKDTFTINPRYNPSDLPLEIYLDSLLIDRYEIKTIYKVTLTQKFNNDTLNIELNDWIKLSGSKYPIGNLNFKDTTIKSGDYIFNFTSSSYLFNINLKYTPKYYGTVQYIYNNDTLNITIPNKTEDINYFSSSASGSISLTDQVGISPTSYTIDYSDEESPGIFQDTLKWQGIYFNNFKISEVKQDSTFIFELTDDAFEAVKRDTSSWLAYISEDKLTVDIDTTFDNSVYGTYNYFSADYDRIKINNLHDTLEWDVTGEIYIPYLKDHYFDINIPCKSSTVLLAETDINSEFQPFPLYEFGLNHFAILLDNDTILGDIDHANKEIDIILPAFPEGHSMYTLNTFFNIWGHDILLDGDRITSGANYGEIDIYESSTYSLKIISYNGSYITYSLNIDIEESVNTKNVISEAEIQVCPNPVVDYVQVSGLVQGSVIYIIDINGKQLLKQITNKQTEIINTSKLDSGMYFLKIEYQDENFNKKIIKL